MLFKSQRMISFQNGILRAISKATRMNEDPFSNSFGIIACDTTALGGAQYGGRSSGSGYELYDAYISTIGETIERYCPALFSVDKIVKSSYNLLPGEGIAPKEFSLYSEEQYDNFRKEGLEISPFDNSLEVYWDKCIDLTTGKSMYCPSTFIYLPWLKDDVPIFYGVSTGLAAHSNFYKSVLTSLFEVIERDSFVITWFQKILAPKVFLSEDIINYLKKHFPVEYEWHFFDVTYDLEIPTVFGICIGKADFGDFIAVGTATRSTKGEALKKVIQEIAQTIPYFRYILSVDSAIPSDDFSEIKNFEQHSIFYITHPSYQSVFKTWIDIQPTTFIDINEILPYSPKEMVLKIISIMKSLSYNVLLKDLTTVDAMQCGMNCTRVIIPQLLQMTGAYTYYPLGGRRLYEVPIKCGYKANNFANLNKFPHPFP